MRNWTARRAFSKHIAHELSAAVYEKTGLSSGQPKFIGEWQKALTVRWKALSGKERQYWKHEAKRWSEHRPPDDVRAQYVISGIPPITSLMNSRQADSHAHQHMREFAEQMENQFNMGVVVFGYFQGPDGQVHVAQYVELLRPSYRFS